MIVRKLKKFILEVNKNIKIKFEYLTRTQYLVLFFLVFNTSVFGQEISLHDSWRWRQFTVESGLPSVRVLDLVETKSGIPWANTALGLAWFNGYYWKPISNDKGPTKHIVTAIIPDERDSVIVLQNERMFYGGQNGFREIPVLIKGIKRNIGSIAYFGNNSFLLVIDSSLYILHDNLIYPYKKPIELGDQKYMSLWNTSSEALWMNASNGLYRWNGRVWQQKLLATKLPYGILRLEENIRGIGFAIISLPPSHAGLWNWSSGVLPQKDEEDSRENILAFDISSDNHAIMVKQTDEVRTWNNGKWQTVFQAPEQLKNILFLKYRSNGDLWVGTELGLFLYVGSSKRWSIWKFPIPDQRNDVNEIIKRNDGSIWYGTGGGLVIHYPDGSIKTIEQLDGKKIGPVTGLIEDNNNNVWISSGYRFDGSYKWDGKSWKHFGRLQGLDAGAIHKICIDKNGRLWFLGLYRNDFDSRGVEREPGAYYYENNKFVHFSTADGLPSARIYSFAQAEDSSYWFGTSAGLCRWQPNVDTIKKRKWTYWSNANGLKNNRIFTLAVDKNNHVWFGDQWSGVGYVEKDTPKYFTTADGLVSDAVWNIKIGADGKIWVATRGGIGLYDNGTWSGFNVGEGLENSRIWGLLPTDDKVYLGSSGGGIQILNLKEFSKILPIAYLYPPLVQNSSLLIHWRTYSLWGEQAPDNIQNRFRIDNEPWSEWNKQRNALIPDLMSGDHVFSIQTKNALGEYSSNIKAISFTIPPPLYGSPLFYIPVGILLLTIGAFSIIYINRKRKDRKALLKSEEQYRNLFETANDAILIFDPNNREIIDANYRAYELYKKDRNEIIGVNLNNFSRSNKYLDEMLKEISRHGRSGKFETSHFASDGSEIFITTSAVAIEYSSKNAVLLIIHDVTEKIQAEAKLRLLAQTVASTQDYVSITDLNNNILFVNDAFARAYGYTPEELFGKQIAIVVPPEEVQETTASILKGTMVGGWNGEVNQQKKDGSKFPVELWTSIVYDDESKPVALVGVAREISERKKMEQEKEKFIKELRDALSEVKALSGLLPICSSCKKIRDDQGYWTQVETYIARHSDAVFTHGLCPDCTKELFPEVYERLKDKKEPPTY
jgi:PAS domain S-box-containing protein